ncbi:Ankyrin repeat-containing protein [Melia azedarach]|uniref:Ankyrin repeat-containing protein n=1 Tax=Melia azedarach TaxID=155640 RepID=A0ACC1YUB8_MELAZ|nr:Ankyrin repeat-containing protein [Melia azedarach]
MDQSLFEDAWTGNVDYLLKLVKANPTNVDVGVVFGGDTPLHIACIGGFSPLHLASAMEHIEIVKQLLKVGNDIRLLKGREKRIPLHYAAIKGRVQIISELLSACAESVDHVTARGETALHLAVKNFQFDAFTVLVEHFKQFNKLDVLNKNDSYGNTILRPAVYRKHYEAC